MNVGASSHHDEEEILRSVGVRGSVRINLMKTFSQVSIRIKIAQKTWRGNWKKYQARGGPGEVHYFTEPICVFISEDLPNWNYEVMFLRKEELTQSWEWLRCWRCSWHWRHRRRGWAPALKHQPPRRSNCRRMGLGGMVTNMEGTELKSYRGGVGTPQRWCNSLSVTKRTAKNS